ncbi:MAG: thioesterase [Spirochaetales bacterium]|nr:thioesterase [Spirochaetales bacterium]
MHYSQTFKIRNSECDMSLKLSPAAVLDYFQEAAGRNCIPYGVAVPEIITKYGMTWVLSGITVHFDSYPSWPEEIVVDTWPRKQKGFKAFREFLIKDTDGKVLVRGSSLWALLDVKTRRPCKTDFVADLLPQDPAEALENPPLGRVPKAESFNREDVTFPVTQSDLDYNNHVNNIRYLIWLLSHMDHSWTREKEISELNIAFTGEARLGDTICLKSFLQEDDGLHSFVREEDGREVCRMSTAWRKAAAGVQLA